MPSAFKRVERVLDLAQAAFDVRERQGCKESEAAGRILSHLCAVIVDACGQVCGIARRFRTICQED